MIYKTTSFIKKLYKQYTSDDVPALAAQASYFLILSVFPLIITIISIIGLANNNAIHDTFMELLKDFLLPDVYDVVSEAVNNALRVDNTIYVSISGFASTVWILTRAAAYMIKGINKAYDINTPRNPLLLFFVSLIFVILLILIIILTSVFLVFGKLLGMLLFDFLGAPELFGTIWHILRYLVSITCLFTAFCMVYIIMPNAQINFKNAIPGAFFTTSAMIILSTFFSYYIANFGFYANAYGSIGAVIFMLVWLYWNATIIIIGAEINAMLVVKSR